MVACSQISMFCRPDCNISNFAPTTAEDRSFKNKPKKAQNYHFILVEGIVIGY
jgi:hypothetical protein